MSDNRLPIETAPKDGTKITVIVSYFDELTKEKTWETSFPDVEFVNGMWMQIYDDHDFPVDIPEADWEAQVTHWVP